MFFLRFYQEMSLFSAYVGLADSERIYLLQFTFMEFSRFCRISQTKGSWFFVREEHKIDFTKIGVTDESKFYFCVQVYQFIATDE